MGLGRLRLPPDMFWHLSFPEWRALTTPRPTARPLARAEFENLISQFPD